MAVRIGFDDNRPLGARETGGRTALPIFREIMLRVYQDQLAGPVPQFPREIEDGIDDYLRGQAEMQALLEVAADEPPLTCFHDGVYQLPRVVW